MSVEKITARYAKALFDAAQSKGTLSLEQVNFEQLNNLLLASKDLCNVYVSPIVSSTQKSEITRLVFANKIANSVVDFIQLLITKKRENLILPITQAFIKLCKTHNNEVEVKVITAVPADAATIDSIKQIALKNVQAKTVHIKTEVNPAIQGGFIIHFGDRIYDNSVQAKIQKIKSKLQ